MQFFIFFFENYMLILLVEAVEGSGNFCGSPSLISRASSSAYGS